MSSDILGDAHDIADDAIAPNKKGVETTVVGSQESPKRDGLELPIHRPLFDMGRVKNCDM